MSKISIYEVAPVPKLNDKLIGTSVGGIIEDVTYNFTLQELLNLFIPNLPTNTLQSVLNQGNTATQDINLTGTIYTTDLDVSVIATILDSYLTGDTHITGGLFDVNTSIGTAGQVLISTGTGVEWYTVPVVIPNLQQVLTSGNTSTVDIILTSNLSALDVTSDTATINNNITIDGTLTDGTASVGTSGKVLSSTVTGVQWVDLPIYSATSPLFFDSATGIFSIQVANAVQSGYLTSADWITFDGKQNAGNYITALTGEATATGPGSVAITLSNTAVIGKILTGLSITGAAITSTDTILQAFGKAQNQINGKQDTITLTTIGNTGPSTLIGATLNIPNYTDQFVGTVTSVAALTLGITGTDLSSTVANSTTTPVITLNVPNASAVNRGALISADWTTFNSKQDAITLTTTGSSGASTFISNTLNVPTYTLSGLGGVPTTRQLTINGTAYDLSADRSWSVGTVTSVGITMPAAFSVASSPVTSAGTIAITGAGLASQYIRGDGALGDFPNTGGGGSSVSYYLNGSINQGTFVGNTYYEMNKTPVIGAGTDFTINADGYIAQFITDANDPASLLIPGGNWNVEMYFSASSNGGTPSFYVELYKYDGTAFTLLGSSSATPEGITNGTAIDIYYTSVGIPETVLTITDRLAIRVYVTHSGRTITLHTEDNHLSEIVTTFSNGLTTLNGLTKQSQYFAVGTTGTDFNISSSVDTHTFNLPTASATNRGALSFTDWTTFNSKQDTITLTTTGTSGAATFIANTLNIPNYADGGVLSLSAIGSTPNANAATITGTVLNLQPADASFGGVVTTGTQTFAGAKTFNVDIIVNSIIIGKGSGNIIYNTVVGGDVLFSNTTGNYNTVSGFQALYNNLGGDYNTSKGFQSMFSNTNGSSNTSVGANSLPSNTLGNNNTAIGRYAGYGTGSPFNNTTGSNNIFIGYQSVGISATESNRTWIGNSSTLATWVGGNLLVGTTANSTFALDVTGTARITGQITLGSTITNGTYIYTLPSATGTIALVGGAGVGTVTSVAALTLGTSGTDLSSTVANSTTTPVITLNVPTASATNRGALSSTDWTTFNSKQGTITLTTTGTSGAATLIANTLNIPQYTDSFVGTVTSVSFTLGTSGTDLSSSVTNSTTTPAITLNVPTASASARGALSAADWTTFNNKQNLLTNPVTGTGTTNYLPKFTAASTIGNSAITDDGTTVTLISRALSGTSASFSSTVSASGATLGTLASGSDAILNLATNASGGPRSIIYRAATAFIDITNTAGTAVFQLSNGGAATFSSTVAAKSFLPAYAASTLANQNSGIVWTSGTITSAFGFVVQNGVFFQGDWGAANAVFGVKSPTSDGSLGTTVFSVSSTGTVTALGFYDTVYSAGWVGNNVSTYTQWKTVGSKNGYSGFYDTLSAVTPAMYDASGNGGTYHESTGTWYTYFQRANACMGINGSATSSSYSLQVNGGKGINVVAGTNNFGGTVTAPTFVGALTGTASGNVYARIQSNWNDSTVINNVVGLLAWKNYGNGHVIFDASQGTSPSGGGVSQTNATYAWSASYPTLMGWNGSGTYGVRVDSARVADSASTATTATTTTGNAGSVTYLPNRTDVAAYPILWGSAYTNTIGTIAYSCAAITIQSSTGTLNASIFSGSETNLGYSLHVNTANNAASAGGGITLWGGGDTTTSYIGFKNSTSTGWGVHGAITAGDYATYFVMDTVTRGWIFRYASVGGTNFAGTNVASISNTGVITANGYIAAGGGPSGGFVSSTFSAGYNRIWSFGNATAYGLGYYQGGTDYIGFHFGSTASPQFIFYQNGNSSFSGTVTAPTFSGSLSGTASNVNSISSAVGGSYTWTGINYFRSNQNTSGTSNPLQAYSDNASGAIMSFHRGGYYAVNMGLDSDNVFRIGGWSAPANLLQLNMSGALTVSGSMQSPTYYQPDTSFYFTVNSGSYGPWRIGGVKNGYSGFIVDNDMQLMIHGSGAGGPCGFYHASVGWSILTYVNADQRLYSNGAEKIATTSDGGYITGNLYVTGNVYANYSDIRLKKDVEVIKSAISKIKQLRGVTYTWNDEQVNILKERAGIRDIGLIAQEVQSIEPLLTEEYKTRLNTPSKDPKEAANFISEESEAYMTVKYEKLVALLVEGIKEQQLQIEELKQSINNLSN